MATPNSGQSSERDQRPHVGHTGEASDAGMRDNQFDKSGAAPSERAKDDPSQAPESGDKPEVEGQV